MPDVYFLRKSVFASVPEFQTFASAGADLRAAHEVILPPGKWKAVPTGLVIALPEGYEAQIRPRSGMALNSWVTVLNSPGTIDTDYRGEIMVILINHGLRKYVVSDGQRIAQMVIAPVENQSTIRFIEEEDEISETDRGSGGFGSTGRD